MVPINKQKRKKKKLAAIRTGFDSYLRQCKRCNHFFRTRGKRYRICSSCSKTRADKFNTDNRVGGVKWKKDVKT